MIRLRVLGEEGVRQIHHATLCLLAETGVVLTHPGARELLSDHGARVERDRVLLPADLVERCVAQQPATIKLQGRDPEKAIELGKDCWYAHNVGGVPNVSEARTGTRRPAARADLVQATRLLDALPNVSSITPHYTPQDVRPELTALWMTYDTLANTTKPIRAASMQTAHEVQAVAEMVRITCPDGAVTIGISPISPLTFPDSIVEAILEAAHQGLILGPLPCPILGATAPMSIAGGLTQQNAEMLAALTLARLETPDLPIIYKGRLSLMDARSGLSVWGNPELGLISAATVEIGHHYGLPVDVYGLCTNAHTPDIQNGYERALNALLPVLAGADEISGVGQLEGGANSCLVQMAMDDEILSSVERIRQGFEVNEDALAVDLIREVMTDTRNFMSEKHTVRYLRRGEVLQMGLAARDSWPQWKKSGHLGIVEHAEEQALALLADHEVPPLSQEQDAALREVIQIAEETFGPN
jgi:trimethylamine--corrinoid protein Co-methyltransferase